MLRALTSKFSMYRLATMGFMGDPMAAPSNCSSTCPGTGNMCSLNGIPRDI